MIVGVPCNHRWSRAGTATEIQTLQGNYGDVSALEKQDVNGKNVRNCIRVPCRLTKVAVRTCAEL